jgi:tyrosyl-tRNA synthetase
MWIQRMSSAPCAASSMVLHATRRRPEGTIECGMSTVLDTLRERGFIQDMSDEEELRRRLEQPITLYCGYDATAPSLHLGHLVTIMALAWYQRFGHRPIALLGGGTALVGDPTGRQSTRPILSMDEINRNVEAIKGQFARFLDFSDGRALLINNADWLTRLNFVEFMRDIGTRFTVNQVLSLEAYRTRLEAGGMTFLELSYVLMQSYDFLRLYLDHDCVLQIGGSDQWGNCISGADLIRRMTGGKALVEVGPLITTGSGEKMGKSARNAPWLSAQLTSPYDYYQYWRNVDDSAVERCLAIFTFLPMDEVRALSSLEGAELNRAKEVLAFEATRLLHGKEAAEKAQAAARALFAGAGSDDTVPLAEIERDRLAAGIKVTDLFVHAGLAGSGNEARKLIRQNGLAINGQRVADEQMVVTIDALTDGHLLLKRGKMYRKVVPA